ncbi:MAG: class I SAM-dependent methyltransferase [Candidatus Heimdallarchaeota archaeon]|nr:class I SAM-dependent methyltransferase [Candidatus Heimdallarchaeota archaeon]
MPIHFDLLAPIYNKIIKQKFPEQIINGCQLFDEGKLLEIGGGTGRFASYFLERVHEVHIVEPSKKMIAQIEKNYPDAFIIKHGFAEDLPYMENSFEHIVISDALHHFEDQEKAVKEVYRVLKPGGCIAIEEIHPKTFWGRMIVLMEKVLLMGSKFYSPERLMELFKQNNFEILDQDWVRKPTTYYMIAKKLD